MLERAITEPNEHTDYKELTKLLQTSFTQLQLELREKKLPVIIVFEGWGASGKGTLIADIIKMLAPRFFKVHSTAAATQTERRYPIMKRFWEGLPEYGKMSVMDRSWYQELAIAKLEEDISDEEYARRIREVNTFERQLTDDGYLIVKFFLHISRREQKRRFIKLKEDSATKWRVTDTDKMRNKNYDTYYKQFDDMLEQTNTPYCSWKIIETTDKQFTRFQLFNILVSQITNALNTQHEYPLPQNPAALFPMRKTPLLEDISFDGKVMRPNKYADEIKRCQKELARLHGKIYKKKIPAVIVFEGWDAAGKGGAIKRVGTALDPRGYEAVPIAAPEKYELNRHYLWRFWRKLPKTGHITIFDRSWYGRVMVERIEKFTPEQRCAMAYREIDEFERELTEAGIVVIKFWIHITKDEQLKRFEERQNTPEKQWKITDEDWRNREKWDQYEIAVNEMLQKTSTDFAPWNIIEGNDKLYARIKVMNTIIDRLEQALKDKKKSED